MLTYFVVQSFERGKRGSLIADQPVEAQGLDQAIRMAERLSRVKAGVVAFSRRGSPATGDYEDAVIVAMYGNFSEGEQTLLAG
ncbi:hypothetical protein MesoLjLc_21900 [Mesorhizobium sp. L-8-10]|uniref:hypothetical protein n=1 Tax=Mesorhizobium sp. L-8-10 TaxID=2744523 RepID=UPI001928AAE9|nr:hypothetical protein [Mesorhizobium sp. L-8-10]BCH30260.1 hypothetical protein MesoLjLc_21900 [Mesorhizobium sp. L-8-10]